MRSGRNVRAMITCADGQAGQEWWPYALWAARVSSRGGKEYMRGRFAVDFDFPSLEAMPLAAQWSFWWFEFRLTEPFVCHCTGS